MSIKVKSGTSQNQNVGEGESSSSEQSQGSAVDQQSTSESTEGNEGESSEEGGALDESKWDEKTAAYIKQLRGEAAKNRTKAKSQADRASDAEEKLKNIKKAAGIADDSDDPVKQLEESTLQNRQLTMRAAVLESALVNGVGAEDLEYYSYLLEKRASELQEGEELSEEDMASIVKEVRGRGSKKSATTSVGNGKGGSTPPPGEGGGVSLDQFVKMSILQKSELYGKNPSLYQSLIEQARAAKRLV